MADESNVETIWIVTDDTSQVSEPQRSYREIAQEKGVKVSVHRTRAKDVSLREVSKSDIPPS